MTNLSLQHGLSFADLYDRDGLVRLDRAFVSHLAETDIGLHDRLITARRDPDLIERLDESNLLVDLAQGGPDIGLGQRAMAAQPVEYVAEAITEAVEHPRPR